MNKSYFSLSILFISLYIPTILGMEEKNMPYYIDKLPIETKYLILAQFKPKDMRLVNKHLAQVGADAPKTWTFMPDNVLAVIKTHDKNIKHSPYKFDLILPVIAEKNDLNSIKWILDNIQPIPSIKFAKNNPNFYPCQRFWTLHASILFAKKNNNLDMGTILINIKRKFLKEITIGTCQEYYDTIDINYFYSTNLWPLDSSTTFFPKINNQTGFFLSYSLALLCDNVNQLKKLCSQTKPNNSGLHSLIHDSIKFNSLNCFKYLFNEYKENKGTEYWQEYLNGSYPEIKANDINIIICDTIKNFLDQEKSQKKDTTTTSSSCTIQ